MPTAEEYDEGARAFWKLADAVVDDAVALDKSLAEDVLGPCQVRTLLTDAKGVSLLNLAASENHLRELASQCTRRREVCADYDTAMNQYEAMKRIWQAQPEAMEKPVRPTLPAPWVERTRR